MPTINLIDANSIGYAGQHAAELSAGGVPTQAIYNVLMNLRTLKGEHRDASFLYLWDDKAQFRYDVYPEYKGNRSNTPEQMKAKEEYHAQQPYIKLLLKHLGVPQMRVGGFEADDLAFHLCGHFVNKGYNVNLISSDKDWLQMLDTGVTWVDMRLDRKCSLNSFTEFTGFENTDQFVQAKCLQGDTSDNINGVGGIGEGACKAIFSRWPSVNDMIAEYRKVGGFTKENLPGKEFSRCRNKLNDLCSNKDGMLATYVRNHKLMNLAQVKPPLQFPIERGERNADAFFDLCGELAFVSVLRKKEMWMNMFFTREAEAA